MAESLVAKSGPEEFLRGALEKIVFFECRVSQLSTELTAERAAVLREKETAAALRAHQLELEMLLAQARSTETTMKLRIVELEEWVRLLEAEREQFLAGFVERTQVSSAPSGADNESSDEQTDLAALAGFIAELRERIEQLKLWKVAAQKAGIVVAEKVAQEPSHTVTSVSLLADRFEKTGRLNVVTNETDKIKELFSTRAERSLYESSLVDLASELPDRRKRAAECLRALGSHAATPLIADALSRENDPTVKVSLLNTLAHIGEASSASLVIHETADPHPDVRAAALDATAALVKEHAEPILIGALSDSSSFIRRRAVLLLSFLTSATATDALITMLSDPDPGVARIAAQALSGRPDIQSQSALTKALNHRELAVRRCAADAVTRWSGETVDPNASPVQRRRTVRQIGDKLTRLEAGALRKAVVKVPSIVAIVVQPSVVHQKPQTPPCIKPTTKPQDAKLDEVASVKNTSEPVVPIPEKIPFALEASLVDEIRTSLRGRTAEELSQLTSTELSTVTISLTILVKQGTISQRGQRFFMS